MSVPQMIATRVPKAGRMPARAFAAGVAALFFGVVGFAKTEGYGEVGYSAGSLSADRAAR